MGADSGEVPVKRRKIRKGTHSCWECRRRKVKCTFASPEHAICITCSERGTKCVSQIEVEGTETREGNPKHAQDMTVVEDQPVPVDSISSSTVPQDIVPDCSSSDSFLGCSTRFSTLLLPGSSVVSGVGSLHEHVLIESWLRIIQQILHMISIQRSHRNRSRHTSCYQPQHPPTLSSKSRPRT